MGLNGCCHFWTLTKLDDKHDFAMQLKDKKSLYTLRA